MDQFYGCHWFCLVCQSHDSHWNFDLVRMTLFHLQINFIHSHKTLKFVAQSQFFPNHLQHMYGLIADKLYKIDLSTCILCLPKKTCTLFLETSWWITREVDLVPKYMWNHKGLHVSSHTYAITYPLWIFFHPHTHVPPFFLYVLLLTHWLFCVILKRLSCLGKSRMLWFIYLSTLIPSLGNSGPDEICRWKFLIKSPHLNSLFNLISFYIH